MTDVRSRSAHSFLLISLGLILGFAFAAPAGGAPPDFPQRVYPAGPLPTGLVIGDFDGDGLPDVAAADSGQNNGLENPYGGVSVLLGKTDRTLGAGIQYTAGRTSPWTPLAMVGGDFNGDGFLDVALANAPPPPNPPYNTYDQGTVSVLLGRGDGTLGPQTHFAAGSFPVAIVSGDFNGDGHLDVVVANKLSDHVSVLLGNGDGTLAPRVEYATAASPRSLAVADLNGDGALDLAVACASPGWVSVFLGRGDGTFSPAPGIYTGAGTTAIAAGDLDGDGHPDLALGNSGSHQISFLRGMGDGTFVPVVPLHPLQTRDNLTVVLLRDVDGDGLLDLVVAEWSSTGPGDIVVRKARGSYDFMESDRIPAGGDVLGLAVADTDHDGRPDIVATRRLGNDVLLLHGKGDGTFGTHPLTMDSGLRAGGIAAADLNGDGRPDLVVANYYGDDISVFIANGPATFAPAVHHPSGVQPGAILVADVDGDAIPDIVAANRGSNDISIYHGYGAGTFAAQVRLAAGNQPVALAAADFDRDGHMDLAAANWASNDLSYFHGSGAGLLPQLLIALGMTPTALAVADFDGDGRPDLAVGGYGLLLMSASPSGLAPLHPIDHGGCIGWAIAAGDFNEDGRADLAGQCNIMPGPGLQIRLGRGDATFDLPVSYGSASQTGSMSVADFDGDGHLDLAAAMRSASVETWSGAGDGTIAQPRDFSTAVVQSYFASADFDGDGRPDLASANADGSVWVLVNQTRQDTPPLAAAGADLRVDCAAPQGAAVTLDGSQSTDADSTPGTNDDIVGYAWLENRGLPSEIALGTGQRLTVTLLPGTHSITLVVTDRAGASSSDVVTVEVTAADLTPPALQVFADPSTLWPPNHRLVPVHVQWQALDACDPAVRVELVSVTSSEPDDAPGNADGATLNDIQGADVGAADADVLLRAERSAEAPERVYTLTYRAIDAGGNASTATATVIVPHDMGQGPEPLLMQLSLTAPGASAASIVWPSFSGAIGYDVIRGDLAALRVQDGALRLGQVEVLARGATDVSVVEDADAPAPPSGEGFFYLIEPVTARGPAGYGTESAPWPRVPDSCSGGCP